MYGKIFRQMYKGTLAMRGPWQAIVTFQQMIVLADKDGVVDMTPDAIYRETTIPLDIINIGLEVLERPDPESRSPDEDGRRIIKLSDNRSWGWRIVNFGYYRGLRSEEDRREYHRQYWRNNRSPSVKSSNSTDSTPLNDLNQCSMQEAVSSKQEAIKKRLRPTDVVEQKLDGPLENVFQHWKSIHRHPKASLDKKRRKVIEQALKHYSEADLCQSITGYLNSPHHRGENTTNTVYDSLELLLRDAAHIDAGLKFSSSPPMANSSVTDHNIRSLTEWVNGNESNGPGRIRSVNGSHGGSVRQEDLSASHRDLLERDGDDEH